MDYTGSTQLSSVFSVNTLKQDGLASGTLTGIDVDNSGVISANFSNGSSTPLGQVALTLFTNPQGLTKLGGTNWGKVLLQERLFQGLPGQVNSARFSRVHWSNPTLVCRKNWSILLVPSKPIKPTRSRFRLKTK